MTENNQSKVMTTKEAIERFVHDGDRLVIGNYTVATCYNQIAEIARQRKKDLTIYSQSGVFDVEILIAGDWYYVAGTFPCFAAVFLWWIATGLDGWVPNGGGVGNSLEGTDAGAGAFGREGRSGAAAVVEAERDRPKRVHLFVSAFVVEAEGAVAGLHPSDMPPAVVPKTSCKFSGTSRPDCSHASWVASSNIVVARSRRRIWFGVNCEGGREAGKSTSAATFTR